VPQGPAIKRRRGGVIGREDGFQLRKISAVDPDELTVSNIKVLSHITRITAVIKGGIVAAKHIWNGMTAAPFGLHKL
jgi:hypothetical protein